MPRPRNHAAHITAAVHDLLGSITRLVEAATRSMASGGVRTAKRTQAAPASSTSAKLRRAVRASWAKYTPAERAARIRKMLAGRGLKPKAAVKRKTASRRAKSARMSSAVRKVAPSRKVRANPWAKLTPAERAARVAKMRAGRFAKATPSAVAPAPASA